MNRIRAASPASRRESLVVVAVWIVACVWTVGVSALLGYGQTRAPRLILGIPSWVVWGVLAPWFVCMGITLWFAACFMMDEPLGDSTDEVGE